MPDIPSRQRRKPQGPVTPGAFFTPDRIPSQRASPMRSGELAASRLAGDSRNATPCFATKALLAKCAYNEFCKGDRENGQTYGENYLPDDDAHVASSRWQTATVARMVWYHAQTLPCFYLRPVTSSLLFFWGLCLSKMVGNPSLCEAVKFVELRLGVVLRIVAHINPV